MTKEQLITSFQKHFKTTPEIYFSPGRVNIIGEHTDYNNGYVMPIAINMGTFVAIAKRNNTNVNVYSKNLEDSVSFKLEDIQIKIENSWQNYIKGTLKAIEQKIDSNLQGADIYIYSNLPFGAGLSSSASLTTAICYAYNDLYSLNLSKLDIAKISQAVEHNFIGTKCGIMDQMACVYSIENNATLIDCNDYSIKNISFEIDDKCLLICDTNIKHNLADSAYNKRREVCENIARFNKIKTLRKLKTLKNTKENFSTDDYNKAKHVFTENQRVLDSAKAMQNKNWQKLGELMYQSHFSLKDNYEVSSDELDYLVELAQKFDGVYGARMTGGGFGGCTIHLLDESKFEKYKVYLKNKYQSKFGIEPFFYISKASKGSHKV